MVRPITTFFLGLLAILLLAVLALLWVGVGPFKSQIESIASDALDRQISFEQLDVEFGREIVIDARGILLSQNAPRLDTLARVDSANVVIPIAGLFHRPLLISNVEVTGVDANVRIDEQGQSNWQTGIEGDAADEPLPEGWRSPVIVNELRARNLTITYDEPERDKPLLVIVDSLQQRNQTTGIQASVDGRIAETPFTVGLQAVPQKPRDWLRQVNFNLDAELGEVSVSGEVGFVDLQNLERPTASLSIDGPSTEYVTQIIGIETITRGPLSVSLEITPQFDVMLFNLNGHLGEFLVTGNGDFSDIKSLATTNLTMAASGPDIRQIGRLFNQDNMPSVPFSLGAKLRRENNRLSIYQSRLTAGDLQANLQAEIPDMSRPATAEVSLQVATEKIEQLGNYLTLPPRLVGKANGDFVIDSNGGEASVAGTVITNLGEATGSGVIVDAPGLSGSEAKIELNVFDVNALAERFNLPIVTDLQLQADADFLINSDSVSLNSAVARIGDEQLAVTGALSKKAGLEDSQLKLQFNSPHFSRGMFARRLPPTWSSLDGTLTASMHVERRTDQWRVNDGRVDWNEHRALWDGWLTEAFDKGQLELRIAGVNLNGLLPPESTPEWIAPALLDADYSLQGKVEIEQKQISIGDVRMRTGDLKLEGSVISGTDLASGTFSVVGEAPGLDMLIRPTLDSGKLKPGAVALNTKGSWQGDSLNFNDLTVSYAGNSLHLKGDAINNGNYSGKNLQLDLNIDDLSNFSALVNQSLPAKPLQIRSVLAGSKKAMKATELVIALEGSRIGGSMEIIAGEKPHVNLELSSPLLDLRGYISDDDELKNTPQKKDKNARLIPEKTIDIAWLDSLTAGFSVAVDRVDTPRRTISDAALKGQVLDGGLYISSAALTDSIRGALQFRGAVTPAEKGTRVALRATGEQLMMNLAGTSKEEQDALPKFSLDMLLIGTGETTRKLAGNTNGYLKLLGSEGRIPTSLGSVFTNDFLTELLDAVNPLQKTSQSQKSLCTVVLAEVKGGVVNGDPLLVQSTERLNIIAEAKIDLATEKLSATFRAIPQKGLGVSIGSLVNPFVGVSGTLANPRISLDPEGMLLEGGAAIATGGLSLLAFRLTDRLLSSSDPCTDAIEKVQPRFDALNKKLKIEL
ncbi:hypothetical protein NOR51B_1630 [Luminiphilus syltensis NOR5-1B]|uniref:AsmA family protein n=1 Tax=Luminiphilus syltensis NOR5-1B TaxID=565045 RepID=B8KWT1_9GAMM|nr:hypothetical protein [Luminiphilus syltensis]EED35683.1 hypothetical protein NOR51B_1630 [Luminiphilus syltensis NOR5-1B]